jgi:hypothetical protein
MVLCSGADGLLRNGDAGQTLSGGQRRDDVEANPRSATTIGEDGRANSSDEVVRRRVRDRALPLLYEHTAKSESG